MRKVFKFVAVVLTIALYCSTLSQYKGTAPSSKEAISSGQSKKIQTYFSAVSTALICHNHQTENILSGIQNPYLSLKKYLSDDLLIMGLVQENLHLTKIFKYASYSKTLSVNNKITLLIFPFHSFL